MISRSGPRLILPCALAVFILLTGPVAGPSLRAQTAEDTADTAIFKDAATVVNYTGNLRRYPAATGSAPTHGFLTLSLSPLGQVTGSIVWAGTTAAVPVSGRLDIATGRGDFVEKDGTGAKLSGAVRMAFRVNKNGSVLVGGGMSSAGESSGFFLSRQIVYSGDGRDGGAILTLGGSNSFSGSSTVINTGTLNLVPGSGNSAISITGGTVLTGVTTTLTTGSSIVLSGNSNLVVNGGATTPTLVNGDLTYGTSVLLHAPVTSTTQADGSIIYTGTNSTGGISTVTVSAAVIAANGG